MNKDALTTLLRAGIAAPSADNSQPWKFSARENEIDVFIDPTRAGKVSDARFLLTDMSIGGVIENLVIQSKCLGYNTHVVLFPSGESDATLHCAKLILGPTNEQTTGLHSDTIFLRQTDRTFPWQGDMTIDAKNKMSEAATDHGVSVRWLEGADKRELAKLLYRAEKLRFQRKELHNELFSSIDFKAGWKTTVNEGLSPATLNIEPFARPVFQAARNWSFMHTINYLGASSGFAFRSVMIPILLSPCLLAIAADDKSRGHIINAGRTLQRIWLIATEFGLSVQPFAAATVHSMGFSGETDQALASELDRFSPKGHIVIAARMGFNKKSLPMKVKRRNVEDFTIQS